MYKPFTILLINLLWLTGCSSMHKYPTSKQRGESHASQQYRSFSTVNWRDSSKVRNQLLVQFNRWKGTPYQFGGTTMRGVDCSAFVQNTFRDKLGYELPRTTREQIQLGQAVPKSALKPGDIVFFKTGRTTLHNGIYLGERKFMHASSSKGVIISTLNNRYWRKNYYTSRRIR